MAKIRVQRGRLYINGTFPKKSGEPGTEQTNVTLQLDDTPAGWKAAEKWLKKIERELKNETFDWADYRRTSKGTKSKTWLEAIRTLRRKKVELGKVTPSTWEVNYWGTLKLMPLQSAVTTAGIAEELGRYQRDQYTYKKCFGLFRHIAKISGVDFPEVGVPTYSQKNTCTAVPSEDEIIEWVLGSGPAYQWCFGMMATFGLRPHECDDCRVIDHNGLMLVQVDDLTKTGFRTVIPQEKEWVKLFNLQHRVNRPPTERVAERKDATSVWLNARRLKQKIKWKPYALRHAYAGRLWRNGGSELSVFDAAQLMGHSSKIHIETYRAWIDPNKIATAALAAIDRNQIKLQEHLLQSLQQD